jgi:hypothetical protein
MSDDVGPAREIAKKIAGTFPDIDDETKEVDPELLVDRVSDALLAAEARGRAAGRLDGINGFVKAILHGNDDHRKWLIDASIDFAAGNPVRALVGKEPRR